MRHIILNLTLEGLNKGGQGISYKLNHYGNQATSHADARAGLEDCGCKVKLQKINAQSKCSNLLLSVFL